MTRKRIHSCLAVSFRQVLPSGVDESSPLRPPQADIEDVAAIQWILVVVTCMNEKHCAAVELPLHSRWSYVTIWLGNGGLGSPGGSNHILLGLALTCNLVLNQSHSSFFETGLLWRNERRYAGHLKELRATPAYPSDIKNGDRAGYSLNKFTAALKMFL